MGNPAVTNDPGIDNSSIGPATPRVPLVTYLGLLVINVALMIICVAFNTGYDGVSIILLDYSLLYGLLAIVGPILAWKLLHDQQISASKVTKHLYNVPLSRVKILYAITLIYSCGLLFLDSIMKTEYQLPVAAEKDSSVVVVSAVHPIPRFLNLSHYYRIETDMGIFNIDESFVKTGGQYLLQIRFSKDGFVSDNYICGLDAQTCTVVIKP